MIFLKSRLPLEYNYKKIILPKGMTKSIASKNTMIKNKIKCHNNYTLSKIKEFVMPQLYLI